MDVKLVIFKSDGRSKEIPIKPGRYVVGRREDATLRIPLPSVSREHCEITHDGTRLKVRDLGSSNGTFRNNERITESELSAGDTLGIGQVVMTVCIDGKPARPAPPEKRDGSADSSMMETPPMGLKASRPAPTPAAAPPTAPAAAPARPTAPAPKEDAEKTTSKAAGSPPASAEGGEGESSVFEFDFDFEDDDRPRL